jgi:hypothetical protein
MYPVSHANHLIYFLHVLIKNFSWQRVREFFSGSHDFYFSQSNANLLLKHNTDKINSSGMDHICTTLNAFRESWPDTSVWDILAGRIRELLLCPECHEPIFTNPQQKNITILTDRHMIHSVCLEYPASKAEEKK